MRRVVEISPTNKVCTYLTTIRLGRTCVRYACFTRSQEEAVRKEKDVAKRTVVRDTGTGQFVPKKEATKRPKETVTEKVPTPRRSSKK